MFTIVNMKTTKSWREGLVAARYNELKIAKIHDDNDDVIVNVIIGDMVTRMFKFERF